MKWIIDSFLKSPKFWLTVVAIIATFLSDKLGLNYEQLYGILAAIVAMILGISIEDAGAKKAELELKQKEVEMKMLNTRIQHGLK